ncbi:hypothetical protein M2463_002242 [Parabacteroides sp. PH5-13]|uniref:DUF4249 domain-containing protein n=1 Tax=unclassified Parabacteroides TaxID=2649774 RepID=UPI002476805A|nr:MULTISPECIES: DUF4249 domain-containing protein [unclassified Parabacteroides]MDH6305241.1 hypothetical protein [Parabacteroides sp. PH5-39]MDH6320226.1 hypothetical protein [Parabacteroides sp. PH5-13]MDH6323831.1 hypothetical protein [Parabacteroides sp. PH5-8]MDH6384943.1 hypothetical protein [Parabacteroides sp. PH5-17]MDH6394423.1 hypothetical protein [Parabacteroides sp. PFB2-22]
MKSDKIILFILFTFLSLSCTKEIDLEYLRPEAKLVLNSVVFSGDSVKVYLSRTWFYTDNYPDVDIADANVKLYVNGEFKDQLIWKEQVNEDWYSNYYKTNTGFYISHYQPVAGDHIRITAEAEGFKAVSTEDRILVNSYLKDLKAINTKHVENYGVYNTVELQVTIKDDPNMKNYYLINFEKRYPVYEYDPETYEAIFTGEYRWSDFNSLDYSKDPLFTSHISALEEMLGYDWLSGEYGRVFSDDLINGKEYTIKLSPRYYYDPYPNYPDSISPSLYKVNLYAISENLYRYLKAIIEIKDGGGLDEHLADVGLAEPVRIFSNIEGGVGIMGTANGDSLIVEEPTPEE